MKKVELQNIVKRYDNQHLAVSDINLTIEPGEFFVLVGPSGCGKSTMLRMIAGLETITEGELRIGEKTATHLPPSKRDLSMVFQNYALYPHLTVEQNIAFGLHTKGLNKIERKNRCEEVAEMLGLASYLKRKPKQLSGGQRQRVALARAIASQSPICLMDEPLSNLDAKLRAHMRSEIKHLQQKLGMTLIYVTHDQVEAMTMADRMMILKDGKIQQVGKPLDIYNRPANRFVAEFIGTPPMNILPAVYDKGSNQLLIDEQRALTSFSHDFKADMDVFIGIRPEHITFASEDDTPNTLRGIVYHSEILGNETITDVELGPVKCLVRQSGQQLFSPGQEVAVSFPEEYIQFFDSNGDSLQAKRNEGNKVRVG
ncbi:ABC transporter ATP-binding protein [Falsibacillus albus]|uniref:ABC transporter ATP-binding protein n=1 Tax=Falsibacillus albus TaxID=2478915 RepID=A0A3L7JTI9_9BACI|nr:ABC transporter ATP-binding protein [Falsibacillus albus]RLQ94036.1 ABC transporter ATP-binding protein [Falsibacillus albus]